MFPKSLLMTTLSLAMTQAFAAPTEAEEAPADIAVVEVRGAVQNALQRSIATGSQLGLSVMETPASVESISRVQLVDRGDARVMDAVSKAAGISVFPHPGNGGSALAARGFTDLSSVTQLYDGTRQYGAGAITFPFDTWSVDSIEVLRGPASVIYGAGAIGGVVNVVPKKPTRGPVQNEIQLGVGSEKTARFGFGSGGALDEQWSYRLDVSGNRSDNWVDDGASKDGTFSGALRYDLSPALNITLSHAHTRQEPMPYFGVPLLDGVFDPRTFDRNYNVADGRIVYRDQQTSLAARWKPGAGVEIASTIYQIKSRRHWRNVEAYEWLPKTGQVQRSDYTEILHGQEQVGNSTSATFEGRLFGLRNTYALGAEFNHTTFQHTNNSGYSGSSLTDLANTTPGQFFNLDGTTPKYRINARQYALFMEDRLQLSEQLSLVGGLRHDHDDLTRHNLVTPSASFDKTFSNTAYRLGTVYQATPDLALYGQYSVAHDPLGALLFTNVARAAFDLARGRQVEAGVKQSFWQRKGEWTLSAYRIVKNKLLTRDPLDISQSIQVGQQSSRGVEATFSLSPTGDWKFEGNAALVHARYDDFTETSGGRPVSRAGNRPTDVPRLAANLFANYRFAPGWTAIAGVHHVGARYADIANTLEMPSYTTTDLALRWQAARNTSLTLRGYNVFDKRYAQTAYYNQTQWLLGADRRAELLLNHSF